jgi:hypothetical protein
MSEIRCSECADEKRIDCELNFSQVRRAIDDSVEETMQGGWQEVNFDNKGSIVLTPLEPHNEMALVGNSVLRNFMFGSLKYGQALLGCKLSEVELEEKLLIA